MHKNYIAGDWVASDNAIENRNPSDITDLIGMYAQTGTAQLETAIEAAHDAQKIWQATGLEARQTALMKIGNTLIDRADLGALGKCVANHHLAGGGDELLDEFIMDGIMNDQPGRGGAFLPGAAKGTIRRTGHRQVDIGVIHDDKRVL